MLNERAAAEAAMARTLVHPRVHESPDLFYGMAGIGITCLAQVEGGCEAAFTVDELLPLGARARQATTAA